MRLRTDSGRDPSGQLTVRLRRNGAAESFVITVFPEPAIGHEWETRTIDFTVDATDSYTLILSNEDDRPSYLSLDAIILLEGCPPDLDGSGQVGFVDLSQLLGAWGACDANAYPADLNCDSSVGFDNLVILPGEWGPC